MSPHWATTYPRRMIRPELAPRTTNGPEASPCGSCANDDAMWFASRSLGLGDSLAIAIFTAESTEACDSPTCAGVRFSHAPAGGKYVPCAGATRAKRIEANAIRTIAISQRMGSSNGRRKAFERRGRRVASALKDLQFT